MHAFPTPDRCASGLTRQDALALIDRVASPIALLDGAGRIVELNDAWMRMGTDSSAGLHTTSVGADYSVVCRNAAKHADPHAELLSRGLHSVLCGERGAFEMEAPCPVGDEMHVFQARVTRLGDAGGPFYLVAHEDLSARTVA